MKWILYLCILFATTVFATEPVTLSAPTPSIAASYMSGTSTTVIYTITNYVPEALPITVSGISNPIKRVTVAHDCGNAIQAAPSSCNIGIAINPSTAHAGLSINQTLAINYQGRAPLTSQIAFSALALSYVTPSPGASSILRFVLESNGTFSTQSTAYTSMSKTFDLLTFGTIGGVQYAYVLDQSGFVYQCTINEEGTFDTCTGTPETPPSWMPHGIAFATVNSVQYAYVAEVNNDAVYKCTIYVGVLNGMFNTCTQQSPSFDAPYSIAFATVGGEQFAYVGDAGVGSGSGTVHQCTLTSDGDLNACSPTPQTGAPAWIPYGVTFAKSQGTQYAYVADNGNGTSTGNVYQCTLNVGSVGGHMNGSFDTCTTTPAVDAPTSNWFPYDIAFATLGETQYAYIANSGGSAGGMYVCKVLGSGAFDACHSTPVSPPSPWQPVGVAFR